jgi:Rrf2 family iron-sulfur cluster assembly transcriptional regulator
MWLSSTAQQAIHAVVCIAGNAEDGPVRVDEIAAAIGCPRNYLSKTLHLLARAGVLHSGRGPKGGFRLAVPADQLSIANIIAPFEPVADRRCLLGRAVCGDANPCAVHDRWKTIAGSVDDYFRNTTVASLIVSNPRASAETRRVILALRNPNQRLSNGSAA